MNNSRHDYYKNNINKRDNDIFNRTNVTNMRSIQLETSANTIGYSDSKQRVKYLKLFNKNLYTLVRHSLQYFKKANSK